MNILDEIVAAKRLEIEEMKIRMPLTEIENVARNTPVTHRPFRARFEEGPVLIAEIKPKSPSAGKLIEGDPLDVANLYAKSEADVISVLTDSPYFGGNTELLQSVRSRVPQSILRKDFIVDEYQVYQSALIGADIYLLIAALLTKDELADLMTLGKSLGLETLVEVHDEQEVDRAIAAGSDVIGINNRNLKTLKIDLATTEELMRRIPDEIPVVSESGIETAEDVRRVRASGARGILVGTSILRSPDPVAKIGELKQALQ